MYGCSSVYIWFMYWRTCALLYVRTHACMHGWMDGWMNAWMDGWMGWNGMEWNERNSTISYIRLYRCPVHISVTRLTRGNPKGHT